MPLRDHFRPPVSEASSWDMLHGGWPMVIVQGLKGLLPKGHVAGPVVHLGRSFEVDDTHSPTGGAGSGGVAVWAALLRQRVSAVIVDVVTLHNFNLYADLNRLLGRADPAFLPEPSPVYAVACRWVKPKKKPGVLQAWSHPLVVGQSLPTLPLWLDTNLAVPLELEKSYEKTCSDLQIS